MAIQKIVLTAILFILALCVVDAVALGLSEVDEGKGASLMNTVGWIIWDFMAIIAQLIALLLHAIFYLITFGTWGEPLGFLWGVFMSANSLVYHIIYFLTEALFGPADLANTIVVAIFHEMGWSTSTKEITFREKICHNDSCSVFQWESRTETTEYIGIGDIPLLGDALKIVGEIIQWLVDFVYFCLGNPNTHSGGIYEIINISAKDPVTHVDWRIPSWFKNNVLYPPIDILLTPLVWTVSTINSTWQWMLRIDILSFAGLKNVVYDAVIWIFDFLPKPSDTRKIFWSTFLMDPPEFTYYLGGQRTVEIVAPPKEEAPIWEAPLVEAIVDSVTAFVEAIDDFASGTIEEEI